MGAYIRVNFLTLQRGLSIAQWVFRKCLTIFLAYFEENAMVPYCVLLVLLETCPSVLTEILAALCISVTAHHTSCYWVY